jgi:hypothetical protein
MSGSESAGLAEAASLEVYAAVAQATRQAGARDSRLGTDAVISAVRRAIAAWVLAADGDETALGYVFTSRRETADEYRKRTGSSVVPDSARNHRVFRLTSGFAEHDERLGSTASVDVRRETAPTRDEAEKLIQPAIWDATVQALGDGDWRPSMIWLDVIELLGE